jgi:hypothetical protein
MGSASAAAFTASVLLGLQDVPLDMAFYYSADTQGFGMFSQHGGPRKPFYALRAFRTLLDTPKRVSVNLSNAGSLAVCAGINADRTKATVVLANLRGPDAEAAFN